MPKKHKKKKPLYPYLKKEYGKAVFLFAFSCVLLVGANELALLVKIGEIGVNKCLKRDALLG